MTTPVQALSTREAADVLGEAIAEVQSVIVGQEHMVAQLMVGLLANGHVLLEGMPGLAKTLLVRSLGRALGVQFERIQFTPDLLPSDVVGTMVFQPRDGQFTVHKGPVFANLVLADEINRAPAKVQSALLEAMQERQVTLGGQTHMLPRPFFVMATQNPVEQEGTYPLPEAQVDRFLLKVDVVYPQRDAELNVLQLVSGPGLPKPRQVLDTERLVTAQTLVREVFMDPRVQSYIVDLVRATRAPQDGGIDDLQGLVRWGASPRASIALALCAKAQAFLDGRAFATPDDVKAVARGVLRHRIGLSFEAQAEEVRVEEIVGRVLSGVAVP